LSGNARGHVLELVRDDVTGLPEPLRGVRVVVRADLHTVGDGGGGARRIGIEDDDAVAEASRGETEHPPELSAAENPDRRRREDRLVTGLGGHDRSLLAAAL
jgi:hypothetical protein